MSDFNQRIQLIEKISEARTKFQAIARPYMKSVSAALDRGELDIDIPGNQPPELGALSDLIHELEDELLILDPATKFVKATRDYREIMADARIKRMQNEAYFRNIHAEILNATSAKSFEPPAEAVVEAQIPQSPQPQLPQHQPSKPRKFSGASQQILAILTKLGMDAAGRLTLDGATLDKFCIEADKQKVPTPDREGWRKSWGRTLAIADGGKDRIGSYLRALMRRNSPKQ